MHLIPVIAVLSTVAFLVTVEVRRYRKAKLADSILRRLIYECGGYFPHDHID